MQIILELNRCLDKNKAIYKTITIDSLDNNLVDVINDTIGSKERLTFDNYYENVMLMNYDRCYPYIIMNDRYEWVVPFEDVSIRDFVSTHRINDEPIVIKASVNCFGGGSGIISTEIISWITFAWPLVLNGLLTTGELFAFCDFIGKVVLHFTSKHNKLAIPTDVAEVINGKKVWSIDNLQEKLGIDDEAFTERLLFCCGFHKKDDSNVFTRNKIVYRKMRNQQFDYMSDCWGPGAEYYDDELDKYWEIKDTVQSINVVMTDIKMHSAIINSDCYEIAKHRLDILPRMFKCIRKGKHFKFLVLNESRVKRDKESLKIELADTLNYLESLLMYLKDREERK